MKLSCRMRPYEKNHGTVKGVYDKWFVKCIAAVSDSGTDMKEFTRNCREIIREFDCIEIDTSLKKPKVGIVGASRVNQLNRIRQMMDNAAAAVR